jgi:SpoVK/Ycf46/Vps4 family AAA+-type ATPase
MSDSTIYHNGKEHLHDELTRLDALLYRQVLRIRNLAANAGSETEEARDIYITDKEIRQMIAAAPESRQGEISAALEPEINSLTQRIENMRQTIVKKGEKSLEKGIHLPLYRLSFLFHLAPFERDILLICLAPELDLKYEKIYAYLQDDITKKQPCVNLVLDMLCSSEEERIHARVYFTGQSRLFRYHLLEFNGDAPQKPLLSRGLKIDDGIMHFLLELNMLDSRLAGFTGILAPGIDFPAVVMEDRIKEQLVRLCDYHSASDSDTRTGNGRKLLLYFQGSAGAGKRLTAEAICRRLGLNLLAADIPALLNTGLDFEKAAALLFRETLLYPAAVYLNHVDCLTTRGDHPDHERYNHYQRIITRLIESLAFAVFLAGETPWNPPAELENHTFVKIEFPVPSYPLRKRLWEASLNGRYPIAPEVHSDLLANKFKFNGGQIRAAIDSAWNTAVMRSHEEEPLISMDDLYAACRSQSNHKLSQMAQKITPHYTWSDIVLPTDKLQQLKEIYNYVKYRHVVYYEWGFHRKVSLGRGLNALFSGSSGTGKTMAAEIIANYLKMDLYKIDLSSVVSKYIGETEKNLNKIFKEAETANAILLFDEADALFGKRSEVRDAHDRYANIEINYLLQKIEEHEGVVILTTNFRKNIDDAFTRRFHFVVDFPFPDQEYRLKIWRNIFPPGIPRNHDVDLDFMARKFKITGGNIKNIALTTAFLAASDGKEIRMEHIILATKREYQKMGSLCDKSEFGKYYELVS